MVFFYSFFLGCGPSLFLSLSLSLPMNMLLYLMVFGILYSLEMQHLQLVEVFIMNIFRRNMEFSLYVLTNGNAVCLHCVRLALNHELIRYNLFVSFLTGDNLPERNMLYIRIRRIEEVERR